MDQPDSQVRLPRRLTSDGLGELLGADTSHFANSTGSFIVDHVGFVSEVAFNEVEHLSVKAAVLFLSATTS